MHTNSSVALVVTVSIALQGIASAASIHRRACDVTGCLNALKAVPGSVGDCTASLAAEGLDPTQDIKCSVTAPGQFQNVQQCAGCTVIGPCDTTSHADPDPLASTSSVIRICCY